MVVGTGICMMSCNNGLHFATKVISNLNNYLKERDQPEIKLTSISEQRFSNTEIKTNILESIRGKDVFIFQDVANYSNNYSIDDNLRALKVLIDACKRSDVFRIVAVIPTFPYARQDKQWGRECVTAKMVSRELELAGANMVITLDLHNPSTTAFFESTILINLKGRHNLCNYIKKNLDLNNFLVTGPDMGGIKRAIDFANKLKLPVISIYKERDYSKVNVVTTMKLIGHADNKNVLIVDDMLDTAGTMKGSCELLEENGANEIYFACSLPFLNSPALERINELRKKPIFKKIITTNVVYKSKEFLENNKDWYVQIDVSNYFAKVICNLHYSESIADYL
jgi:ribose-phosphate pyrophosphokinase